MQERGSVLFTIHREQNNPGHHWDIKHWQDNVISLRSQR